MHSQGKRKDFSLHSENKILTMAQLALQYPGLWLLWASPYSLCFGHTSVLQYSPFACPYPLAISMLHSSSPLGVCSSLVSPERLSNLCPWSSYWHQVFFSSPVFSSSFLVLFFSVVLITSQHNTEDQTYFIVSLLPSPTRVQTLRNRAFICVVYAVCPTPKTGPGVWVVQ
jgi:hypothetical protein